MYICIQQSRPQRDHVISFCHFDVSWLLHYKDQQDKNAQREKRLYNKNNIGNSRTEPESPVKQDNRCYCAVIWAVKVLECFSDVYSEACGDGWSHYLLYVFIIAVDPIKSPIGTVICRQLWPKVIRNLCCMQLTCRITFYC